MSEQLPGNLITNLFTLLDIPQKRQKSFIVQILVLLSAVVLILFVDPNSFAPDVVEGQICPKTIRSPRNISFIDEQKTNELRRLEADKVEPVFVRIPNADQEMLSNFEEYWKAIDMFYQEWKDKDPVTLTDSAIASYFSSNDKLLEIHEIKELLSLSKNEFELAKSASKRILQNISQKIVTRNNLETTRNEVNKYVLDFPFSNLGNRLVVELVKRSLKINSIEDEKATQQKRENAAKSVIPVKRKYEKGQIIVEAGAHLTGNDMFVLKTIEKQIHKNRLVALLGNILLITILIIVAILHLHFTESAILKDSEMFRLMCSLWIFGVLLGKVAFSIGSAYDKTYLALLLSPLPAIGLLSAIFLNFQVAVFQQMLLGILMFVVAESEARIAIVGLLGGVIGILGSDFPLSSGNVRRTIGWAGIKIGGVNLISLFALLMIDAENFSMLKFGELTTMLAGGFGNGIFTAILTNGVVPYIESFFALATGSRLLELADLSHPLFKRLAEEAPGTYQHSIMVGALSEAAAKEIKADSLLAKIGGYFHDIGKLKRPQYFSENQTSENRHDHLTPYMSSLILVGHIRDGVDLAREYGLPERIHHFITQHHGTTLISYFYEQAKTDKDGGEINPERFRYPGPKPQMKETAIVMLADSVEAAARTLPQYSHSRIESLVKKIIDNKLNDENQLDESDLTLKDLEKIEQSFVRVLSSMYHSRIDYPGKLSNQPKGGSDGSSSKQQAKES